MPSKYTNCRGFLDLCLHRLHFKSSETRSNDKLLYIGSYKMYICTKHNVEKILSFTFL